MHSHCLHDHGCKSAAYMHGCHVLRPAPDSMLPLTSPRQQATWNDRPPDAQCLCLRRGDGCSSDAGCLKEAAAPGPLPDFVSSHGRPGRTDLGRALAPVAGRVTLGLSSAVSCTASGCRSEPFGEICLIAHFEVKGFGASRRSYQTHLRSLRAVRYRYFMQRSFF